MKVSLNWVKKYVDLPKEITNDKIAYDMTLRTVEVEGVEPNIVVEVIAEGYLYKDRVLRPSMVKVSK